MSKDVGPELISEVLDSFETSLKLDPWISAFMKRLQDKKATQKDCSIYADRVGIHASDALKKTLTEDRLPDGRLYWNIAERVITALMKRVHSLIIDVGSHQLKAENEEKKIGIKPIKPKYPEERIRAIINAAVNHSLSGEANDG